MRIHVVDSHTAGEPTRVVLAGAPPLRAESASQRREQLQSTFDHYRRAIVTEPRGSDILVGAYLYPSILPECHAAVIFFNNVGYLGMCGHGMMGVVATLAWQLGWSPGVYHFETPVGKVSAEWLGDGRVEITNVPSYRLIADCTVNTSRFGTVTGDIVWSGNGFFVTKFCPVGIIDRSNVAVLMDVCREIKQELWAAGHQVVDHVEINQVIDDSRNASRNFVLCPGDVYDRSPCGTGTSAKIACLAVDGELNESEVFTQFGVLGTAFTAYYRWQSQAKGVIIPYLTGQAFLTAESTLFLDRDDPFRWGIESN